MERTSEVLKQITNDLIASITAAASDYVRIYANGTTSYGEFSRDAQLRANSKILKQLRRLCVSHIPLMSLDDISVILEAIRIYAVKNDPKPNTIQTLNAVKAMILDQVKEITEALCIAPLKSVSDDESASNYTFSVDAHNNPLEIHPEALTDEAGLCKAIEDSVSSSSDDQEDLMHGIKDGTIKAYKLVEIPIEAQVEVTVRIKDK